MSRRRGEFEHRTSIFEGAFRAWSHLGGLEPAGLESKSAADLDPILHPIQNDPRLQLQKEKDRRKNGKSDNGNDNDPNNGAATGTSSNNNDGNSNNNNSNESKKKVTREYAYEPLPRTGLVHPFVQAILSPWLGPDADQDAIQLGLTTLRTWWQHRRKGESGSAIVALGTEKMTGVVEGYTRHFFNLAHCLVMNDGEQPPRTLGGKMKEYAKSHGGQGLIIGDKRGRKRTFDDGVNGGPSVEEALAFGQKNFVAAAAVHNAMMNNFGGVNNLMGNGDTLNIGGGSGGGLLDRLQASQRRLLAAEGGVSSIMPQQSFVGGNMNIANNAMPTTASNKSATAAPTTLPPFEMKGRCIPGKIDLPGLVKRVNAAATQLAHRGGGAGLSQNPSNLPTTFTPNVDPSKYGDPNIMPVVLISQQNDVQILMTVNGITCAHCVKIIETVLKGPPGRNTGSPIEGLVDAAADQELDILLIKIKSIQEARRIAYEASRNLMMVGYTAQAESVDIQAIGKSGSGGNNNGKEEMSLSTMYRVFETVPKVNPSIGNVLDWKVECECPENNVMRANCRRHQQMSSSIIESFYKAKQVVSELIAGCGKKNGMPCAAGSHCSCKSQTDPTLPQTSQVYPANDTAAAVLSSSMGNSSAVEDTMPIRDGPGRPAGRMSTRMSLGGMLGRHSLTSNTTFGRAMSGLSALSIDWENMDDFDINVDHSEGINNDIVNQQKEQQERGEGSSSTVDSKLEQQVLDAEEGYGPIQRVGPRTARRSSLRNPQMNAFVNANMNVHFDM